MVKTGVKYKKKPTTEKPTGVATQFSARKRRAELSSLSDIVEVVQSSSEDEDEPQPQRKQAKKRVKTADKSKGKHKETAVEEEDEEVNLANGDVMGHITKLAVMETTQAIWEYDPTLEGNSVLGGNLDVIAAA
jgi:hypothetical protein